MLQKQTSWSPVASWYHELLKSEKGTYQHDVILPNILRLLNPKKNQTILDLACGPGFFARELGKSGAKVIGIDISSELIAFPKKTLVPPPKVGDPAQGGKVRNVEFFVASADAIPMVKEKSVDV